MMNAIAERAERIESEFWRQMVERLDASSRAQLGIKALKVAGGTTLMAPGADVASINRTISLGVRRKLETAVVREVSALYCKAGVERWMVEWCPLGTPDTGYREIAECGGEAKTPTVKFYADLVRVPRVKAECPYHIEVATDAALWGEAMVRVAGWPMSCAPLVGATVGREGWRHYFAVDSGVAVGVGALCVNGRGAYLGFGATEESHRNRGIQAALIQRRLQDARALGCRWVSSDTEPDLLRRPSVSYRNMRRAGLQVVYYRTRYLFRRSM